MLNKDETTPSYSNPGLANVTRLFAYHMATSIPALMTFTNPAMPP